MQRSRLSLIIVAILALFAVIAVRLTWLQAFEWRYYYERAETRRKQIRFIPAPRGSILDRHGRVLAEDVPHHELVYTLRGVDPAPLVAKRLAGLLSGKGGDPDFPYDSERLKLAVKELRANFRPLLARASDYQPHPWVTGLSLDLARRVDSAIRERPLAYPGIDVVITETTGTIRVQPDVLFAGELAIRRVARHMGIEPEPLVERVDKRYQAALNPTLNPVQREFEFEGREWVLAGNVPFDLVVDVTYFPERYPGLRIREGSRRRYPGGPAVAQIIGDVGPFHREDIGQLLATGQIVDRAGGSIDDIRTFQAIREDTYLSSDRRGHSGLEKRLESRLKGTPGARIVEIDGRGRVHGPPLEEELAVAGGDVALTLDLELCERLREFFVQSRFRAGSAVVGDPRTGEIFAAYSHPSYDPETLGRHWNEIRDHPGHPRLFRPTLGHFPPGSTFKLAVAIAGLEDQKISPSEVVYCERRYDPVRLPHSFRCSNHNAHPEVDLRLALGRSCNVYFYRLGADRLGLEGIRRWGSQFGFGHATGVDVLSESAGSLPTASPQSASIGQGFVATPLQVFRFTCGVAQRGVFPSPRFLRESPVRHTRLEISANTWHAVIDGMRGAVSYGTASDPEIGLSAFDCAVKTGTAEFGKKGVDEDDIAWIVGFAPVDDPRLAFAIEIEQTALHGGEAAGPMAAGLLHWFSERQPELQLQRGPGDKR